MTEPLKAPFADALIKRVRQLGHPLCVGFDPHLDRIPSPFRRGSMRPEDPATADAVADFLGAVLERVAERVSVIKPHAAFFEQLGWPGLKVLQELVTKARELGVLVLMDAKRGDIGSTAKAYAAAHLGADAPFPAHALTVNPYLGLDTLEPFIERAASTGAGVFVLVRTSNPGAGTFQDLKDADGRPLFHAVAEALAAPSTRLAGAIGFSGLGVVFGATWPGEAEAVRERLPHALVLVPGYGAQGGSAKDAVRAFVPGPNGLEGGVVSSSRGILFPAAAGDSMSAWEAAFEAGLDQAIDELGDAVAGGEP
ncbi:MAG: orotidine-5'-phosphate decarboxylase [Acidobacteriota bacterium]